MPTYTSNSPESTPAERGVCVTSESGDLQGKRLLFQSHGRWVRIPNAGVMDHAGADDVGIYTTGQFQCIAVIVAKFNGLVWTEAHLAHVSHYAHSLLTTLYDQYTDESSYVAIGAKPGSLIAMQRIRDRFAAKARNVWVYAGGTNSPDFGMNREGYFGETVQWVEKNPTTNAPPEPLIGKRNL